ncbi:hypothetical protein BRC87_12280 [Halobacteriales archaeon QS_4_66_20]|nr:MAG: hypothetical protein BRC87_12280 [Halobacteriales archaeon QS_4_66_20]
MDVVPHITIFGQTIYNTFVYVICHFFSGGPDIFLDAPRIVNDAENSDASNRAALAEYLTLDESRQPAYVVLGDLNDDGEKLARAIKQNVIGRDTGEAVKTHAVEQYIETTWDRTDGGDLIRPETDTDVAEKLGVDWSLVSRVVKNVNAHIIDHERLKACEYYEVNPDAEA